MTPQQRSAIGGLALSALAMAGIYNREGFTAAAVIPVPGDVPTIGHGTTIYPDGSRVKLGDTITRQRAGQIAQKQISDVYEAGIKRCAADVPMYQWEYDAVVDLSYNVGVSAVCRSSIIQKFRNGDYSGGCTAIKSFKYFQGKDCTIKANKCGGIPKDRYRVYQMCMGGQP